MWLCWGRLIFPFSLSSSLYQLHLSPSLCFCPSSLSLISEQKWKENFAASKVIYEKCSRRWRRQEMAKPLNTNIAYLDCVSATGKQTFEKLLFHSINEIKQIFSNVVLLSVIKKVTILFFEVSIFKSISDALDLYGKTICWSIS